MAQIARPDQSRHFSVALELTHRSWTSGDARERVDRTLRAIRLADEAGFDSVWLTEDPDGWDAFAVLGAVARETTHIRLGTGVTNPYLRHPNLLAASVSTIDRLANGRAFLGLGRGQPEWYRTALGMEVRSPLAALEAAIDLLRQWWRPPYTASGRDPFPVHGWERSLAPQTPPPGPPIYVAATGKRMLELAGRLANGVRFNELASLAFLRSAVDTVRAAALAAGRDPAELLFFCHPSIVVTDDPAPVLEQKKATIATIHALPGMERQIQTPGIDVDAVMAEVRTAMRTEEVLASGGGFAALRRAGDLAAAKRAIPLELMERVAVVGPLSYVRQRLTELAAAGITHLFVDVETLPDDLAAVESFVSDVIP
jgi:5,10-methylenetetrahydromethanopterin reductase